MSEEKSPDVGAAVRPVLRSEDLLGESSGDTVVMKEAPRFPYSLESTEHPWPPEVEYLIARLTDSEINEGGVVVGEHAFALFLLVYLCEAYGYRIVGPDDT